MALSVVGMTKESGKNQVVIRSDFDGSTPEKSFPLAITELKGADARRLAQAYAARELGMSRASTELPGAPYPVDPAGEPVIDVRKQRIDHYRVDIPISGGLL